MTKHRVWFTLVLRAIGIYLLATTIHTVIWLVLSVLRQVFSGGAVDATRWYEWFLSQAGYILQAGIGFYLVFGARRFVDWCMKDLNCCPGCGYELAGVPGSVCPECGTPIAREETPNTTTPAV